VCACACVWLHATVEKKDPSMCSVALFGERVDVCIDHRARYRADIHTSLRLSWPNAGGVCGALGPTGGEGGRFEQVIGDHGT
jgi:hypothetical protein